MTFEEFFIDQLNKMFISKDILHPGNICFKDKDSDVMMYYDKERDYLWVNECIWSVFDSKYKMSYDDIQELIRDILCKHIKWKVKRPIKFNINGEMPFCKHLKWKVKK